MVIAVGLLVSVLFRAAVGDLQIHGRGQELAVGVRPGVPPDGAWRAITRAMVGLIVALPGSVVAGLRAGR